MSFLCEAMCELICDRLCCLFCYQISAYCCPESLQDKNLNSQPRGRELQDKLLNQYQKKQYKKEEAINKKLKIPVYQQQFSYYVQQLYDLSNSNNIEVSEQLITFISPPLSYKDLIEYYAKDNSKIEEELTKNLIGYRRVRVDGNCFYAAFMYQYLEYVLNYLNYTQFNQFIAFIQNMNFEIIPIQAQYELANYFADRLIDLRRCPIDLFKQFSDSQDLLFGLSILFIRNLINQMYCRGKMMDDSLSHDFLFWEKEFSTTMNEIVMALLAEEMKLQIHYYCVDLQRDYFKHEVYNEQRLFTIHLIQKTGHFQIGVPIGVNK